MGNLESLRMNLEHWKAIENAPYSLENAKKVMKMAAEELRSVWRRGAANRRMRYSPDS